MARLPAVATSLAVHAVAFAAVVLVPIFGNDPLPETGGHPAPIPEWPMSPKIVLADSRPASVPRRAVAPSGAQTLPRSMAPPPVANTFEPAGEPTDPGANVCANCTPSDSASVGPAAGPDPIGDGAGEPDGRGDGPLRPGGQIRPPSKLRHVNPEYPELARQARIQGDVVLDCLIDAAGRITEVRVLSGHPLLAPAAVAAVSRWVYSPTELNGVAVPVLLTVTVRFNLGR